MATRNGFTRLISGFIGAGVVIGAAGQPGVAAAAQVFTTDCNFDFKETCNQLFGRTSRGTRAPH